MYSGLSILFGKNYQKSVDISFKKGYNYIEYTIAD